MQRYEYKVVELKRSVSWRGHVDEENLLATLNREGRSGWRLVASPSEGTVPTGSDLLERTID